jgi:hypothetical protein
MHGTYCAECDSHLYLRVVQPIAPAVARSRPSFDRTDMAMSYILDILMGKESSRHWNDMQSV